MVSKTIVKKAIQNALENGEEYDIPYEYSDDNVFTDLLDDELYNQGFEFERIIQTRINGEYIKALFYSRGDEEIYILLDTELKDEVCVGLVTEL